MSRKSEIQKQEQTRLEQMKRRASKSYRNNIGSDQGFTLVEVALVVLIAGILLATVSSFVINASQQARINETNHKIEKIDEAIQLFLDLNGMLPCVADPQAAIDTAPFADDITMDAIGPDGDCDTEPVVGGVTRVASVRPGINILIGSVPTRSLNLPDDYGVDAWGNRFTYAVTEDLATQGTYDEDGGGITVLDTNDNPLIPALPNPPGPNSAQYIIVSHGPDGAGAFSGSGAAPAVACAGGATEDGENCNGDSTFRNSVFTSNAVGGAFFDDMVRFRANSVVNDNAPSGMVVAFNLAACPNGWTPFGLADGRAVIGVGDYIVNETAAGHPAWAVNETFALGQQGGFAEWRLNVDESVVLQESMFLSQDPTIVTPWSIANNAVMAPGSPNTHENRQPYVALTYCQKT